MEIIYTYSTHLVNIIFEIDAKLLGVIDGPTDIGYS